MIGETLPTFMIIDVNCVAADIAVSTNISVGVVKVGRIKLVVRIVVAVVVIATIVVTAVPSGVSVVCPAVIDNGSPMPAATPTAPSPAATTTAH